MSLRDEFSVAGVQRAEVFASDIMARYGTDLPPPVPTEAFQNAEAVPDPVFGDQGNSNDYMSDLISGNDRKETLMQVMYPDRDYEPPKVDTGSLMRDAGKAVTDGAVVARQAANGMQDVKEQQVSFKQDWQQAKTEAVSMLKESAKSMDIDPGKAVDQMVAKREESNVGIIVGAGATMALGGGTMATAGAGALNIGQELSKEDKKLPPKEQEALLIDTLKRLQESRKPVDTREVAQTGGKTAPVEADGANQTITKSDIAWEDMKIEDFAELLQADPDGMDQPEMQVLMEMEYALDGVQRNHEYVKEHYADDPSSDKMLAAQAAGNEGINRLILEAEFAPSIDAGDAHLAGESIGDVKMAADKGFDSLAVQTIIDWNQINAPQASQQLNMEINRQFSMV